MHPKNAARPLICLLLAIGAANAAAAPDGATLFTEKTCITCHGADGKAPILPVYPRLAGQNPDYLFQQLQDIKSGTRTNALTPAMQSIIQNVDESEMRILADWLGSLSCN